MKRLYLKIYLTIVVTLLLVVLVAGGIWRFGKPPEPIAQGFEVAGELLAAALPPASAPVLQQQDAIRQFAQRLRVNVALFDANLDMIASYGDPPPPPHDKRPGWMPGAGGAAWAVPLPDGRWIVARAPPRAGHPAISLILVLGGIALMIALAAFPVVKGLTRRLERLQHGVETLGAGNLGARVEVRGCDEVAQLAQAFNKSAARIEELVNAHRLLLAHASHEIRTPLSRIRLGIEMMGRNPDAKAGVEQDIAELDALVDDILLASRLDMNKTLQQRESVDLLALAAEEGTRYDNCNVEGIPVTANADPRLLRHLIRNLLDNAAHHGAAPLRVDVRRDGGNAIVDVMDAGEGIPEAERERVFVPFYRLPGEAKGSGLGLSIARQIARLHGGDVSATTRADSASCVRVSIPLS